MRCCDGRGRRRCALLEGGEQKRSALVVLDGGGVWWPGLRSSADRYDKESELAIEKESERAYLGSAARRKGAQMRGGGYPARRRGYEHRDERETKR